MKHTLHPKSVAISRRVIYTIAFIFAVHQASFTYINSSFLSQFIGENNVGLIYTAGSILSIIAFIAIRPILRKYGNYHTFAAIIVVDVISLLMMSFAISGTMLITAYIVGYIARNLVVFHLDIFLEDVSEDKDTGGIRGVYLSLTSISYIIGPLLAGLLLTNTDYWKVYLMASIIVIPTLFILFKFFKHFKDPEYKEPQLRRTAKRVLGNKNMYSIFAINSLLRFFYAWMVIYTPIYMMQNIGFTISEVTFLIGIGMIAFVILEAPLGHIADKYTGEKEFLIVGFIILAISTGIISFIDTPNFWLWAGIIFATRTGASFVESMSEAYFFKKIDSSDINVLGFFRILQPVVYAIAPLLASLLLLIVDIKFLFLILGAVMLYGIRYSLVLEDTL